ncbi:MAG: sulfatase [Acidobacteria bacterium]|jgi:arylsulfatase A-like enzyme|nr:sulfatase [Acidobacteriota bacterium]
MRTIVLVLLLAPLALVGCQTAPSEPEPPPNILFAIADDASHPHMSAYGTSWVSTPAFDRVAREGVLFARAYTPNAKCAPSRSIVLTGRHSWQLGAAANHWPYFPEEYRTYAEALADHGYHVGYTGKGWAPGVARDADGQPRQLAGTPFQEHKATPPADHVSDNDYAANFAAFLDARPEGQPFCFWYGAFEPHRAYQYGVGVDSGGRRPSDIDAVPPYWPDTETVRTDMLDYAFEIEHFDAHLQRMLNLLEERGELERTLVVVTADNGMPFPRAKGNSYEVSNHMPLAIMWPAGIKGPGRQVDDFVSFLDFAPTFLEVAGVSVADSGMKPIEGRSLTSIFRSGRSGQVDPERDHVLVGKERHDVGRPNDVGYPIRGILTDRWLFLVNFEPDRWPAGNPETGYLNTDGSPTKTEILQMRRRGADTRYWELAFGKRPREELYDLQQDPPCVDNLAAEPAQAGRRRQLRERLFDALEAQGDPRMKGEGSLFDEYLYADESSRGFYDRYMRGESPNAGWVEPTDFEPEPLE